jgi:16S rRNA G966 N2-methylase RsmD
MALNIRDRVVEIRKIKASEIMANPSNWRQHPAVQKEAMVSVLNEIGAADVLKAYIKEGALVMLDGHLRQEVDPEHVWNVAILDFTEDEANEYLATHDTITGMATINKENLKTLLSQVSTGQPALAAMMEKLAESAGIIKELPEAPEPQINKAEELNKKWKVKLGDMWQLGEHRIICGDCTDVEVVKRLMGGEKADIVFTDPPYNVSYQDNESVESLKARNRRTDGLVVENDSMSDESFDEFLLLWFSKIKEVMRGGGSFLCVCTIGEEGNSI